MSSDKHRPREHPRGKATAATAQHRDDHRLNAIFAGANATYRRAILKALESLHDYQLRSNVDAIRRHTQDLLENTEWNDALFLQTLKSIVRRGEVDLFAKSTVEFSPEFKKKRADSLVARLEEHLAHLPPLDPPPHRKVSGDLKPAPVRKPEHDKWKIMPKKEYDHSTIVNPMDMH